MIQIILILSLISLQQLASLEFFAMYHHLAANVTIPETVTKATRFYDLLIDITPETVGRRRTKELLLSWYHTLTTKALCEFLQCVTGEYGLITGHSLWVIG